MLELISCGISLCAVCVSAYAVFVSKCTQLNATYFAEKVAAYNGFLSCAVALVLTQGHAEHVQLVAATYRVQLFAPAHIVTQCQAYCTSIWEAIHQHHLRSGSAVWTDAILQSIADEMKRDLAGYKKR